MDEQTSGFYEREAVNLTAVYDLCDGGIAEYVSEELSFWVE